MVLNIGPFNELIGADLFNVGVSVENATREGLSLTARGRCMGSPLKGTVLVVGALFLKNRWWLVNIICVVKIIYTYDIL